MRWRSLDRMGVTLRFRQLSTPLGLALALAVTGSTSAVTGSNSEPSRLTTSSATTSATEQEPAAGRPEAQRSPASLTPVPPTQPLVQPQPMTPALEPLLPAIHIASSGPTIHNAVRVDIADVLLRAYRSAADGAPASCHVPVSLLAAIGQVESGSLVGRPLDAEHRTSVLGPVLNGNGFAAIPDTDHGKWDGNAVWDRAVGPMQFIPGTWRIFGADGDGGGVANPQDVEDAAAGTAAYLCYGGRDLAGPADVRAAILSYNHSEAYLQLVATYQQRYAGLGLDDDFTLAGLPSSISLIASPTLDVADAAMSTPSVAPQAAHPGARPKHAPRSRSTASSGKPAPTPSQSGDKPIPKPKPKPDRTPDPKPKPTPDPTTDPTPNPTTDPTPAPAPDPQK